MSHSYEPYWVCDECGLIFYVNAIPFVEGDPYPCPCGGDLNPAPPEDVPYGDAVCDWINIYDEGDWKEYEAEAMSKANAGNEL